MGPILTLDVGALLWVLSDPQGLPLLLAPQPQQVPNALVVDLQEAEREGERERERARERERDRERGGGREGECYIFFPLCLSTKM